ncbi:hypothetical protein MNR01_00125 [Lysobacter sp. S4-A87]|uniref:hypothetical protein n=1 Tax=Lysobacter sp. S4-A87 TaxID=2925843 RepID=UPI001F52C970|nr:hypothetical protein [Lysobacter sp. S4-A87]UNK49492.1 hypothetical protein MNR01_00125 [Lysobacter sp. S4-A87]
MQPRHGQQRPAPILPILFALMALATTAAQAQTPEDAGQVRFTGPLVSSAPPLPKGLLNIEPYLINTQTVAHYDTDGHRRDIDRAADDWQIAVPIQYGATDRLTLGITLNAAYAQGLRSERHLATGDTRLSASWLLAHGTGRHQPKLTISARQNVSTGQHDRLELQRVPGPTGSGTDSTTLALDSQAYFLARSNLRGRAGIAWRLPGADAGLHGQSSYGTHAGFKGNAELGDGMVANVGAEYSINSHWVLASDVVYEYEDTTRVRGQDELGAVDVTLPSSWRLSVAPAAEYHWSDNAGVIFGALVSLDGRNSAAIVSPQVAVNLVF